MKLTSEQQAIIASQGDIKINAVAGSGKTTTMYAYAKSRPQNSKILYLAFNKTVKSEAERKFQDLANVKIETAHSLAYKHIVYTNKYQIKANGYNASEIVKLLKIKNNGEKHAEYVFAHLVLKITNLFCNSDVEKVAELDFKKAFTDEVSFELFRKNSVPLIHYARTFLALMNSGEIEVVHDFYLKKFQLSKPTLPFDYVLFDEGQDASPAMLDIFLRQKSTKVIVGDEHQQIYGWRMAVNSLAQVKFQLHELNTSFRFHNDIATLASKILERKNILNINVNLQVNGAGSYLGQVKTKAIIGRTNLMLLLKAIEYINEKKEIQKIYFEGHINSYTYAEDGASLYDILNLYNGKTQMIRDPLIKSMANLDDLEDYIDQTNDVQLSMMLELVQEHGNELYNFIKVIKEKHVSDDCKHEAQVIFSTVHRSKGMEYDQVQLLNDFISTEKLKNLALSGEIPFERLSEEINLLYVAVTRAKRKLIIPEELLPEDFPPSPNITALKHYSNKEKKAKENSLATTKEKPSSPQKPIDWTLTMDRELRRLYFNGTTIQDMAHHLRKTKGAVAQRIKYLKLETYS